MVANVQYPYKEINLAQIQENSSKHDHRTVLPATFCKQNTMETGTFLPFVLITSRAVSYLSVVTQHCATSQCVCQGSLSQNVPPISPDTNCIFPLALHRVYNQAMKRNISPWFRSESSQ